LASERSISLLIVAEQDRGKKTGPSNEGHALQCADLSVQIHNQEVEWSNARSERENDKEPETVHLVGLGIQGGMLAKRNAISHALRTTRKKRDQSPVSMRIRQQMKYFSIAGLAVAIASVPVWGQDAASEPEFPVRAEPILHEPFGGCEGIAFNGEGRMFVTGSLSAEERAFFEVLVNGSVRRLADLDSTLGIAAIGERDLLVADFGPTSAFREDRNSDGIIWRITPEGEKTAWVTGIGDPNFILVREDGSLLVSDDATSDIYVVGKDRVPRLFSTAVPHPNGLALSDDGLVLYVAQIFKSIRPVVRDDSLWALRLVDGKPAGAGRVVARLGPYAANDGLAMDRQGRVYVAANGPAGEIWRYDPQSEELVLITRDIPGAASIAFGQGEFDTKSIYVTTTFSSGKGGRVYRVPVGAEGQRLMR
jgi:sugar lactone lactonase YvrE